MTDLQRQAEATLRELAEVADALEHGRDLNAALLLRAAHWIRWILEGMR